MSTKIDPAKLADLVAEGKSQAEIGKYFGVSKQAVQKAVKKAKLITCRNLATLPEKTAPRMIKNYLNASEQLIKINRDANELLDLVMGWQRGDKVAIRILESQMVQRKIQIGDREEIVKIFKFKDPRDIALNAMRAIKEQLSLQLEMFKTMYSMEAFQEFKESFLRVMARVDPNLRDELIQELQKERLLPDNF